MTKPLVICGDARAFVGDIEADVVITDPVWPNAPAGLYRLDSDPENLLRLVLLRLHPRVRRVVVVLGVASDPRFLRAVPARFPFVRTCWLRYACPSYFGTVLNSGDVAYVFGSSDCERPQRVLPGEFTAPVAAEDETEHPTPRKLAHMRWLVSWFTRKADVVLDPFAGSGTTLVAAQQLGRPAVGIELEPAYVAEARRRLDPPQQVLEVTR